MSMGGLYAISRDLNPAAIDQSVISRNFRRYKNFHSRLDLISSNINHCFVPWDVFFRQNANNYTRLKKH